MTSSRIGDKHLIDVVGYDTLTVAFPGDLFVKLLDVAYVPDIAFNVFSMTPTHKQGERFTTEEEGLCFSIFGGKLRFEGDGSTVVVLDSHAGLIQTMAMYHSPR